MSQPRLSNDHDLRLLCTSSSPELDTRTHSMDRNLLRHGSERKLYKVRQCTQDRNELFFGDTPSRKTQKRGVILFDCKHASEEDASGYFLLILHAILCGIAASLTMYILTR